MYYKFNQSTFTIEGNKVLAAEMYIKGDAIEWIRPYVDKYLENNNIASACSSNTRQMFNTYNRFKIKISKIFSKVDKVRFAEQKIQAIKQKEAAFSYTTKFKQLQNKIDQDNALLIAAYYIRLKEKVKDKIAR